MSIDTLKRVTAVFAYTLALAIGLGELITFDVGQEMFGRAVPVIAGIVSLMPLVMAGAYFAIQAIPGGRATVPLPLRIPGDGWLMLLICCEFVPRAGDMPLVPAGWWGSSSSQTLADLLVLGAAILLRIYHLRRSDAAAAHRERRFCNMINAPFTTD